MIETSSGDARYQFFGEIVASTLIASVAVAPFAAYNFHQIQQYAVLGNMIAIPICNLIVMPAALSSFGSDAVRSRRDRAEADGLGIEAHDVVRQRGRLVAGRSRPYSANSDLHSC